MGDLGQIVPMVRLSRVSPFRLTVLNMNDMSGMGHSSPRPDRRVLEALRYRIQPGRPRLRDEVRSFRMS